MIWIDYLILSIIGLSMILGIFRGLIKEIISLATWIIATWGAFTFNTELSEYLKNIINHSGLRIIIAFALILLITFIIGTLLSALLKKIINKIGLTGLDRFLGAFFGIGRGVLIIIILIMLSSFTPFPKQDWWKNSRLLTEISVITTHLQPLFPKDLATFDLSKKLQKLHPPQP